MCGIAGIYWFKKPACAEASAGRPPDARQKARHALERMIALLQRRGPDDHGIKILGSCGLANTRLSIIDLSKLGHQPMSDKAERVWITYNGEIYNFRELRKDLEQKGAKFKSNTDTEVIIQSYMQYGEESFKKLRGMFAFALWDDKLKKLYLVRDRFGIKPLYYYKDDEKLIFASEVRAIAGCGLVNLEQDTRSRVLFFLLGSVPLPLTTFKNAFAVPSSHYMLVDQAGCKTSQYYSLDFQTKHPPDHDRIYSILREAVKLHLISDAPLGVFLSGGIDSSTLVALSSRESESRPACAEASAGRLVTLSVIFERDPAEQTYQRTIANRYKTDHREIVLKDSEFIESLSEIMNAMDQPTINGVNTFFISKAARKAGLKVVLSGLGGDEIFCGYNYFYSIDKLKKLQRLPQGLKLPIKFFSKALKDSWMKLDFLQDSGALNLYLGMRALYPPDYIARILDIDLIEVKNIIRELTPQEPIPSRNNIDFLSFMELKFYLQNQLLKDTDFMSMYHSLEVRVPFLDHELVDYVAAVDSTYKLDPKVPKNLLIKSIGKLLDHDIIYRKKQGFVLPFHSWMKRYSKELRDITATKQFLNKRYCEKLWKMFEKDRLYWSRAWALVVA